MPRRFAHPFAEPPPSGGRADADAPSDTLTAPEVLARQCLSPDDGLAPEEVARRAARFGRNEIRERGARSMLRMLLDQFTDFMVLVLLVAAVVSGVVGDLKDTLAIVVIVALNAGIGFVQELRAERAMAALKQMAAGTSRVVRGGEVLTVAAAELVPGDVVLLEAGNVVPADLRLIEVAQLRMDEALLTGESVPVEKTSGALASADLPLGDRRNMVYKGATAISLALGATRLASQHALVRRLPAVETLGSVTCICSDKTGTLTMNRMRVVEVYCAGTATRDWKAAAP